MKTFLQFIREDYVLLEGGGKNMFLPTQKGSAIPVLPVPKTEEREGHVASEPISTEHRNAIHSSLEEFGRRFQEKTGHNIFGNKGIRYGGSSGPIMDKKTTPHDLNRWGKHEFNDIDTHATEDSQNHLHGLFKNDGKDNRFKHMSLHSMTRHGSGITSALFHFHHPEGHTTPVQIDLLHTPKGPAGEEMDPAHIVANSSHREDLNHKIKGAHRNAFAESLVSVLGGAHHSDKQEVSEKTGKPVKNQEPGGAKKLVLVKGRVFERFRPHPNGGLVRASATNRENAKGVRQHQWIGKRLGSKLSEDSSMVEMHKALTDAVRKGHVAPHEYNEVVSRYNDKVEKRGGLRMDTIPQLERMHGNA
jgi:hypothetical protein